MDVLSNIPLFLEVALQVSLASYKYDESVFGVPLFPCRWENLICTFHIFEFPFSRKHNHKNIKKIKWQVHINAYIKIKYNYTYNPRF